jgi:hypothetical protein
MEEKEVPAMPRIYVRLTDQQAETLVRIAEAQKRHPSDQAALYVERGLGEGVHAEHIPHTPKEASHAGTATR